MVVVVYTHADIQVRPVPREERLGIAAEGVLQAGCPSCHHFYKIKTLKEVDAIVQSLQQFLDVGILNPVTCILTIIIIL